MKKRNALLILVTIILIALIIGGFFFLRSSYLLNQTRLVLETQLEKQLKHPVTIGHISGNMLTGLNIEQFEISDSFAENPALISLDEIAVKYRLWSLLRGKFLITRLDLKAPQVNARIDSDGNLNLAKLIPKEGTESSGKLPVQPLISDISVENGAINFDDVKRAFKIAISGIHSHSRIDGPLAGWKHIGSLEVRDGRFELNGVETQIDEFKTEFELQENEGALQSFRLALGNSLLTVAGKATNLSKQSPLVETQVQLTLDFHDVQKILSTQEEIEGVAEVNVEASGTISEIVGQLGFKLPFVQLNNLQLENLIVQAEFTPKSFRITQIDGTLASGKLTGGAEININPEGVDSQNLAYKGWLQLASLRAEQLLPMIIDLPEDFLVVKGRVDGKIQFSGSSSDPHDIELDGNLKLTDAALNDVPIRVSGAHYMIDDDRLSLTANLDEAQIELNGKLGLASQHDLDLRITSIDVGKLAQILRIPDLAGDGIFTGKSTSEVLLSAHLNIPEATLFDVPIGVLTADFHYADDRVFLHPVRLIKGESELIIEGVAWPEGDVPVELTARMQPFQIADYVRLAGADYPIEGVATGTLVLDGTLGCLDGRGTLQIVNGKAWDLALDPLTLPLEIEDYVVKISDFELLTRGQRGILTAQINADLDYEIEFQSEPMRLGEIALARRMTDFQLDAELVVKANGKANANDPRVNLSADISSITYAGKPLADVYITGAFMNNALNFEGAGFDDTCQIRGVLESAAGSPYQIAVDGTGVDVLPFLRIFDDALGDYITGTADGNLDAAGALEDPTQFKLKMSLSRLALGINEQQLINPSPINLNFADNLWQIQSFALADRRDLRPFLNASGAFRVEPAKGSPSLEGLELSVYRREVSRRRQMDELRNTLDFTVESDGFALEYLADVLALPPVISGTASYKLTGSGRFDNPQLALDWAIPNLSLETPVGPIAVSEAEGQLVYQDGSLTINLFDFLLLGNPVGVQGDVQVAPDNFQSSVLNLQSSISNFQLASLDEFFPQISQLGGRFDLKAQITGDLSQPELIASIHVAQGTMQLLDFPQPVEGLEVNLQVSGGQKSSPELVTINLKLADWQLGGGQYHAQGDWRLPKTEDSLLRSRDRSLGLSVYRRGVSGGRLSPAKGDFPNPSSDKRGNQPEASLRSILDALEDNDSVAFRLQLDGTDVNLMGLVDYVMGRDIPNIEGRVDMTLELQGSGYRPDLVSAALACDDLHINIKDREVQNLDEIHFRFADGKLKVEPLQIGGEDTTWLNAAGTIDVDGNMDFLLEFDRLPYAVLIPAVTLTLFDQSLLQLDGNLTSQIQVQGNLAHPIIMAKWESDGRLGNAKLKDVGYANYQERLLVVRNTQRIAGVSNYLDVSGRIPINLAFQPLNLPDRFLNLPIDLRMRGQRIPLTPLALLFYPLIEEAIGTADIDLKIQGTTASPYPQGKLSVWDGMLKPTGFDTPISQGRIELVADRGEIRIPKLSFQIGQGKYDAEVKLRMNGLTATHFEVSRFKVNKARISDFARDLSTAETTSDPDMSRWAWDSKQPRRIGAEPAPIHRSSSATQSGDLNGYITAEASLNIPVDQFIIPGETAWAPKLITPFNPPNVIKYVTGELNIQNILVEGLGYQIRNPRSIEIQLANQKLSLKDGFILEDQKLAVDDAKRLRVAGFGSWELGKKLLFHIGMRNFDLGFISGFLPDAYAVRGFLNASLDIRGTDAEPKIDFTWETPELWINQAEVDQFTGSVVYEGRKIRFGGKQNSEARFSIGRNRASLSGLIPFHLSLLDLKAESLSQDTEEKLEKIEGRLDIVIENLDFLPLIIPQFAFSNGTGGINVTLGGQIHSPKLKGFADLKDLAFELPDSHIKVEDASVNLDFTNNNVNIQRIEGILNGGTFDIHGAIQSNWLNVQRMDVFAKLSGGTTFEQTGLYWVRCHKVDLEMKGPVTTNGSLNLPPLSGSIRIDEGRYEQHWKQLVESWIDKEAEVQFEVWFDYPVVRDLQLDLDIVAPNNLWVESNLGKIKVEASVNGKIVGPVQNPVFNGRVELLEGELSLFAIDHQFEIKGGSYIENKDSIEFNPWYDITAETVEPIRNVKIPNTDGQIRTKDLKMTAHLSGYLNGKHSLKLQEEVLRKEAGEEYQLTPSQLLSILTLGRTDPFASESSSASATSDLFLRQSQRYLGSRLAKVTGLSETRLDLSPDDFEKSRFILTKELSKRLALTYSSTFQLHTEPRIEVEYQISRHFAVKGERNEQGKYGIDLKLEQRF